RPNDPFPWRPARSRLYEGVWEYGSVGEFVGIEESRNRGIEAVLIRGFPPLFHSSSRRFFDSNKNLPFPHSSFLPLFVSKPPMDTERWSLVKSIFQDVLEQAPAARTAFLEGACGADVALRSAVLGLLAADEDATNFLETPALEADMVRPPASTHPERVGAYRICRELGRGGMGTVYLAERADGAFEQQVALKIARRGLDTT